MKVKSRIWIPLLLLPLTVFFIYSFTKSARVPSTESGGAAAEAQAAKERKTTAVPVAPKPDGDFGDYWYQGKAELSSYTLEQARYGEIHQGRAVLVFVAEDFSTRDLTKSNGKNGPKVPVLKCNFDKKFNTGIYPYSMMLTVASAVDLKKYPHALKVAMGSQEWCGHTYTQLNLKGDKFEMTEHSYFPGEGDVEKTMDAVLTEDELWTRLRISPDALPTGDIQLIPSTFYMRLRHHEIGPKSAKATLSNAGDSKTPMEYHLVYADGSREIKIHFRKDFPHVVQGWEESYLSGFGPGAQKLTTKATLRNTIQLDYWNHNSNADAHYRKELGLEE